MLATKFEDDVIIQSQLTTTFANYVGLLMKIIAKVLNQVVNTFVP